jgi:hypothetical protein
MKKMVKRNSRTLIGSLGLAVLLLAGFSLAGNITVSQARTSISGFLGLVNGTGNIKAESQVNIAPEVPSNDAAFVPGNLAVVVAAASANNTTASVIELDPSTPASNPVQTIAVPGDGTDPIRISGSATSTGYASRTADGSRITFMGANSSVTGSNANTLNPRAVVAFTADGNFSIATTYTGNSGNQTRAATSLNNMDWFIADQGLSLIHI